MIAGAQYPRDGEDQRGILRHAVPAPVTAFKLAMEEYVFSASRFTRGNRLFPVRIQVTREHVVCIKPQLIGSVEESIPHFSSRVRQHSDGVDLVHYSNRLERGFRSHRQPGPLEEGFAADSRPHRTL